MLGLFFAYLLIKTNEIPFESEENTCKKREKLG